MFQKNGSTMSSIIGPDLEIKGDMNIQGDLLIYGRVNGNIICKGSVSTAKGSIVEGNISTENGDFSGTIIGNVDAKHKVSLSSSAQLNGDLKASILIIEEGAKFNGLCGMQSAENNNKKVANLNEGVK
tara:strand:- start:15 stop:398 length:384 start_codon:yes stop_codon:yes gene_type:complete